MNSDTKSRALKLQKSILKEFMEHSAKALSSQSDIKVKTATLDEPEHGLTKGSGRNGCPALVGT